MKNVKFTEEIKEKARDLIYELIIAENPELDEDNGKADNLYDAIWEEVVGGVDEFIID